jgi:hypothetical protein
MKMTTEFFLNTLYIIIISQNRTAIITLTNNNCRIVTTYVFGGVLLQYVLL